MTNIPEWQDYCDLVEPDVELLKTLLETKSDKLNDPITRKAVERKYRSLVYQPTVIEKTMTPEQLFTFGHPLWEKPHTINEIEFVLRNIHACTCYEEMESMVTAYSVMVKYLHYQRKKWKEDEWT